MFNFDVHSDKNNSSIQSQRATQFFNLDGGSMVYKRGFSNTR